MLWLGARPSGRTAPARSTKKHDVEAAWLFGGRDRTSMNCGPKGELARRSTGAAASCLRSLQHGVHDGRAGKASPRRNRRIMSRWTAPRGPPQPTAARAENGQRCDARIPRVVLKTRTECATSASSCLGD